MPSKIEDFFKTLQHDNSVEDQIQQSGIINSYILTTKSAMNARRDADLCLWCNENWSIDHNCENAFEFNCMFTFGEEGEGVALLVVSNDALKRPKADVVHDGALAPVANRTFHECLEPGSSLFEEEAQMPDALQMFDEMPRHEVVLGECVVAVNKQNDTQVVVVHQVFDEMSEPTQDDSGELQVGSSKKVEYGAYKVLDELSLSALTTGDNDGLDSSCCVRDNPADVMDCAHEMFDGIPVSDYLFKMAQTTPAAPTVVQSVPVSDIVATTPNVEGIGDNFQSEYRRQMFAKLASLDDSLFQDFIVVGATTERFSTLIRVLLHDCHVSDEMPRDTYRECDSNYQVKTKFFVAFPETHPHNFVENVVWPLSVMDMSCFTSLSLYMFFSVEVHNLRAFELENDWMAFLNFKELHSWGTYPSCLSSLLLTISLENYIGRELFRKLRGVPDKCSLNTRIFDPGGRRWSVINVAGLRMSEMLGFVFDRGRHMVTSIISGTGILSFLCNGDEEIVSLFLCYGETSSLFDDLLFYKTVVLMFRVTVIDLVISGICVKAVIISHTLEDKGDFEAVGNIDVWLVKVDTSILNVAQSRAVSLSISLPSNTRSQCISAPTLTSGYDVCTLASRVLPHAACKTTLLLAPTTFVPQSLQILIAHWHVFTTPFMWPSLVYSSDVGKMKSLTLNASKSSTFVFDPGGNNNALKMCGPQVRHCDSKRPPKAMGYENHQSYIFDPGGSVMIFEVNDATESRPKYVLDVSYRLLVFFDP